MNHRSTLAMLAAALWAVAPGAQAHTSAASAAHAPRAPSADSHPWGVQGDPAKATRVVHVRMLDTMRFRPDRIDIRQGETVNFLIENAGKALHEFVIGTPVELSRHAELMKKNPGMEHAEPYMAHVRPGGRERLSWRFTEPGEFQIGCLLPGHYESGMKATIRVRKNTTRRAP